MSEWNERLSRGWLTAARERDRGTDAAAVRVGWREPVIAQVECIVGRVLWESRDGKKSVRPLVECDPS